MDLHWIHTWICRNIGEITSKIVANEYAKRWSFNVPMAACRLYSFQTAETSKRNVFDGMEIFRMIRFLANES